MIIDTKYLGKVEIDKEKILYFESGLPGFEHETQFVLLHIPSNNLFQVLQSVQTVNLAFIVTNPYQFYKNYKISMNDHLIDYLQVKDEKEIAVFSILTLKEPFEKSTMNLKAPLLINLTNKRGKQYILNEETYPMRASISLPNSIERGV